MKILAGSVYEPTGPTVKPGNKGEFDELNKPEYNKHYMMLIRNLKRDHNDTKVT